MKEIDLIEVESQRLKWLQSIKFHLDAIGIVTGFMLTILAVVVSFGVDKGFKNIVLWLTIVALISLVIQILFWLDQISRNREIAYQEFNLSIDGAIKDTFEDAEMISTYNKQIFEDRKILLKLQSTNTTRGKILDAVVLASVILIFAIIFFQVLPQIQLPNFCGRILG